MSVQMQWFPEPYVEMISAMLMESYYLRRTADLRKFIQLKS